MATTVDYIEYVVAQVAGCGRVSYKKMFGEYLVYVNDKPILLVCDNTVYVKILPALGELMKNADRGFPYQGAKEHYILDVDDVELTQAVITIIEPIIPFPKRQKKKEVHQ